MLSKEEKLEELEAASVAYGAYRSLKDFKENKKAALSRLFSKFRTLGITEQEWWRYLHLPENQFMLDPEDPRGD